MPRRQILLAIYALHDKWANEFEYACHKGCATCCTRSVTMTTLEGELIHEYITGQRADLIPQRAALTLDSPAPAMTTNQFAAACLRGEEVAEPPGAWDLAPCLFLRDGCCAIYPARPFMCRGFGSRVRCDLRGEAEIAPLLLTLNTVIMQCLEHLDQGRPWGNMQLILRGVAADAAGEQAIPTGGLALARPLPGFLLLPEDETDLAEQLRTLMRLCHIPSA